MVDKERILIKKCAKGDIDAFEQLIGKYEKTAYNVALKMLGNQEDAMDLSQEALIKVFKSIKGFNYKSSFSTWLYRIVVNTCLDHLKKNKEKIYSLDNPIETVDGEIQRDIADESTTPEVILEKKLTRQFVHESIEKLDEIHKTVIILRDIQGFSYDEISKILDCSTGTVKSRIKRGRDNLRTIILKEMEQNEETFV